MSFTLEDLETLNEKCLIPGALRAFKDIKKGKRQWLSSFCYFSCTLLGLKFEKE